MIMVLIYTSILLLGLAARSRYHAIKRYAVSHGQTDRVKRLTPRIIFVNILIVINALFAFAALMDAMRYSLTSISAI